MLVSKVLAVPAQRLAAVSVSSHALHRMKEMQVRAMPVVAEVSG